MVSWVSRISNICGRFINYKSRHLYDLKKIHCSQTILSFTRQTLIIHKTRRITMKSSIFATLCFLVSGALAANHFAGINVSNSPTGTTTYTCRSQADVRRSLIVVR